MQFVTDEFLTNLGQAATGLDPIPGVTDVIAPTDPEKQYFDIEVISDSGRQYGETQAGGATGPSAEVLRVEFAARLLRRHRLFAADNAEEENNPRRQVDLLVNCGDLLPGGSDAAGLAPERADSDYRDAWLPAFRGLQEHSSSAEGLRYVDVLSVPGNEDVFAGGGQAPAAQRPYYRQFAGPLTGAPLPDRPEEHPVAAVFRVLPDDSASVPGGLPPVPLAFVVVIGFDSNGIQYNDALIRNHGQIVEEQFEYSQRLVANLQTGIARNVPLYVIVATHHNLLPTDNQAVGAVGEADRDNLRHQLGLSNSHVCAGLGGMCVINHVLAEKEIGATSNASALLRHCQELRASLVLHGATQRQRFATTVAATSLAAGESPAELTVVAAPAFDLDQPTSGLARVRLDLWKGEAEVAFQYDTAPGGGPAGLPVQITRPLISASRIQTAERRLYQKVGELIAAALSDANDEAAKAEVRKNDEAAKAEVREFARYVADCWGKYGYTAVSDAKGRVPVGLGGFTRVNRYNLLLLLREADGDGNYEILLSKHTPLRPGSVGEWDTLLMPAFSTVRNLMERLHNDIVRQVVTQAEDLQRSGNAKEFDRAVERIQSTLGNLDDLWLDRMREVGSRELRRVKISPTSGELTEYEYHLVTLMPFVSASTDKDDERKLVEWLGQLPSIQPKGLPWDGRDSMPMEAITGDGRGVRWEPSTAPAGSAMEQRKQVELPPGSVWFPLPEPGSSENLWREVPSVVARNADVMDYVDEQLAQLRETGTFTPYVVLGRMTGTTGYELREGPFPFDPSADAPSAQSGASTSTREAMDRVEYLGAFDFAGEYPYLKQDDRPEVEVKRIVLARRQDFKLGNGQKRDVICVFDPAADYRTKAGLEHFATCPADEANGFLGLLRPTQRYVLEGGLERAEWVNKFLDANCADDPWGFLRATYGGAGQPVAMTPPIIEQVWSGDLDSDGGQREFLVCDGNHRVVWKVWKHNQPTAAIGVLGEPWQPYYARPFSPYEWDITADNAVAITPPAQYKYATRRVAQSELRLDRVDADTQRRLKAMNEKDLYRRYYRDLTRGFGSVGGQGGRW